MNRVAHLVSFIFIALISCSHEEKEVQKGVNMNPDTLLLQRSVEKNYNPITSMPVTTYWYCRGLKVVGAYSHYERWGYRYERNLIKGMSHSKNGGTGNFNFIYDDQERLIRINASSETEKFTYNDDGTVTVVLINNIDGILWTGIITLDSNRIGKIVKNYVHGFQTIDEYTYDNKNSPTKNIIGFDKLSLSKFFPRDYFGNIVSKTYADNEGGESHVQRIISYNPIGFPVAIHSTDDQSVENFDAQFVYY